MSVVISELPGDGTALLWMRDTGGGNSFTPELLASLREAVGSATSDPSVRVLVLHGTSKWFSSGAGRAELRTLSTSDSDFRELGVARVLIDSALPVVTAVEGHAFGGGLVLALSSDLAVIAEESMYAANFMSIGFTPGMGCTRLLPERLGSVLATEMMMTGRAYRGAELRARGAGFLIVPRATVAERAVALARDLAEKPRTSLMLLKRHLTRRLRASLATTYDDEIDMHRRTMRMPEVLARIEELPDVGA